VGSRYSIDLRAHMAECDANYYRLMKLVPNLREQDERALNLVVAERALKVRIRVLERCPYTTLMELTQLPLTEALSFELPAPRLTIRLYHDARTAEVIEFQNGRRFDAVYEYPNGEMRQRDEKAQINRFLSEYLSACLLHGATVEQHVSVANGSASAFVPSRS
jgi:uncharacterized protein YqiB (DUF1249 family)